MNRPKNLLDDVVDVRFGELIASTPTKNERGVEMAKSRPRLLIAAMDAN